jgi:hypothetical protein
MSYNLFDIIAGCYRELMYLEQEERADRAINKGNISAYQIEHKASKQQTIFIRLCNAIKKQVENDIELAERKMGIK